jgi:hypothetical protein
VFDDAFTVGCPSIDAEGKVSSQRAHLRPLLPHSSSSRFTAGASDDLAEVHGLDFPGAWVKHSPPKRLRNAGSVWETESNIEWLDLVSTPAAANWDASFTVERTAAANWDASFTVERTNL